jgi:hypothetical protein
VLGEAVGVGVVAAAKSVVEDWQYDKTNSAPGGQTLVLGDLGVLTADSE